MSEGMMDTKKCDICGEMKSAFTDNTTITVEWGGHTVRMFIQTSFTPPRPDICADCFPTVLKKLALEINKMEDAS